MTSQEIQEFIFLNDQFHLIADEIVTELNKRFDTQEVIDAIGLVEPMELTDLRRLDSDSMFVWFHEPGEEGTSIKIPLKAFSASKQERKSLIQQAVDEKIGMIKQEIEDARKQQEDRERLDYERLRKRFEGK
jgi:hypothetical protein